MATTVVHTIKASGGDYTSLSAWEAAQQRNLVTLDEISVAECYGFIDTIATAISGWTTGVNNYIIIRAHPSAKATVPMTTDGSRYLLKVTTNSTNGIQILNQYTKIYDIQVEMTSTFSNTNNFFLGDGSGGSNTTFRNCVARAAGVDDVASCWRFQGVTNVLVQNCVGIMANGNSVVSTNAAPFKHANASVRYDNCLAFFTGGKTGYQVSGPTGGTIFRNCISANIIYTNDRIGKGFDQRIGFETAVDLVNSTNNISTDGTALGINAIRNQPVIFANASIGDFHLDWMDPVAQRSGVDLSASNTGSFNDDFDGNIRTTPWHAGPLRVINSPNGIQLGNIGNSNIRLSSTGTSPITIR